MPHRKPSPDDLDKAAYILRAVRNTRSWSDDKAKMSQQDVANAHTYVSRQTISTWETGHLPWRDRTELLEIVWSYRLRRDEADEFFRLLQHEQLGDDEWKKYGCPSPSCVVVGAEPRISESAGEDTPLLKQRDRRIMDELLTSPFAGRRTELGELNKFVEQRLKGYLLINGPPGSGKSKLLAKWIEQQKAHPAVHICCHFFSRSGGNRFSEFLRCLAEQLLRFFQMPGEVDAMPDDRLILTITKCLEKAHQGTLVVVIDAIDEIRVEEFGMVSDWRMFPGFEELRDGTYVVFSASSLANQVDSRQYRNMLGISEFDSLSVENLSDGDIADMIRRWPNAAIAPLADDSQFVTSIHTKTGGLAIYASCFVDQVCLAVSQGQDPYLALSSLPDDFRNYVALGATSIRKLSHKGTEWDRALCFLSCAKGPLTCEDLSTLPSGLEPRDFDFVPLEVQRWLTSSRENDVLYYDFKHHAIAEAYRPVVVGSFETALLSLCEKWHSTGSRYPLFHMVGHVCEICKPPKIYEVARDEVFLSAQDSVDVSLPTATLRAALRSAIDQNDLPEMAEFALRHALWLEDHKSRNPLEALREGKVDLGSQLAGLWDGPDGTLWNMLLSFELLLSGDMDKARTLLKNPSPSIWELLGIVGGSVAAEIYMLDKVAGRQTIPFLNAEGLTHLLLLLIPKTELGPDRIDDISEVIEHLQQTAEVRGSICWDDHLSELWHVIDYLTMENEWFSYAPIDEYFDDRREFVRVLIYDMQLGPMGHEGSFSEGRANVCEYALQKLSQSGHVEIVRDLAEELLNTIDLRTVNEADLGACDTVNPNILSFALVLTRIAGSSSDVQRLEKAIQCTRYPVRDEVWFRKAESRSSRIRIVDEALQGITSDSSPDDRSRAVRLAISSLASLRADDDEAGDVRYLHELGTEGEIEGIHAFHQSDFKLIIGTDLPRMRHGVPESDISSYLVPGLLHRGLVYEALSEVKSMDTDSARRAFWLGHIATEHLCDSLEQARETIRSITRSDDRCDHLIKLAERCGDKGDFEGAGLLLEEAEESTSWRDDLESIVVAWHRLGNRNSMARLLEKALSSAIAGSSRARRVLEAGLTHETGQRITVDYCKPSNSAVSHMKRMIRTLCGEVSRTGGPSDEVRDVLDTATKAFSMDDLNAIHELLQIKWDDSSSSTDSQQVFASLEVSAHLRHLATSGDRFHLCAVRECLAIMARSLTSEDNTANVLKVVGNLDPIRIANQWYRFPVFIDETQWQGLPLGIPALFSRIGPLELLVIETVKALAERGDVPLALKMLGQVGPLPLPVVSRVGLVLVTQKPDDSLVRQICSIPWIAGSVLIDETGALLSPEMIEMDAQMTLVGGQSHIQRHLDSDKETGTQRELLERVLLAVASAARGDFKESERRIMALESMAENEEATRACLGARLAIGLIWLDRGGIEWATEEFRLLAQTVMSSNMYERYPVERLDDLIKGLLHTGQSDFAIEVFRQACGTGFFRFPRNCEVLERAADELAASGLVDKAMTDLGLPAHKTYVTHIFASVDAARLKYGCQEAFAGALYVDGLRPLGGRHCWNLGLLEAARLLAKQRQTACKYIFLSACHDVETTCNLIPMVVAANRPDGETFSCVLGGLCSALDLEEERSLLMKASRTDGTTFSWETKLMAMGEGIDLVADFIPQLLGMWRDLGEKLDGIVDEFERENALVEILPEINRRLRSLAFEESIDANECRQWLEDSIFKEHWGKLSDETQDILTNAEVVWRLGEQLSEWGMVVVYLGRALEVELQKQFSHPLVEYLEKNGWADQLQAGEMTLKPKYAHKWTLGNIKYLLSTSKMDERVNHGVRAFIAYERPNAQEFLIDDLPSLLEPVRWLRNNGAHLGHIERHQASKARSDVHSLLCRIVRYLG